MLPGATFPTEPDPSLPILAFIRKESASMMCKPASNLEAQIWQQKGLPRLQVELSVVLRGLGAEWLLTQGVARSVPFPCHMQTCRPNTSMLRLTPLPASHSLFLIFSLHGAPQQCVTAILQQKEEEVNDLRMSLEAQTVVAANQLEAALLMSVVGTLFSFLLTSLPLPPLCPSVPPLLVYSPNSPRLPLAAHTLFRPYPRNDEP